MATRNDRLQCTWMMSFSSVHICMAFRLLRRGRMKLHALLGHPVSENFVSWCQRTALHRFYVYRKSIDHLHDLAIWKWLKNVYISFDLKCICVQLWCLDNWSRILSGKPFNTFSMTRLNTLQFRLILTPRPFHCHACIFSLSFTIFFHDLWLG